MINNIITIAIVLLLVPSSTFAKCKRREAYYCVSAIFKKEMPELITDGLLSKANKKYCSGLVTLGDRSVTVVFQDKQPCPTIGSAMVGHLSYLCQDTVSWTEAHYWYSREQDFCKRGYEESFKQAQSDADKIHARMTRSQIHELLAHYIFLSGSFTEQYYLHPDIVLEVPFEEPGGAYSSGNEVNGPAVIKKIKLPLP